VAKPTQRDKIREAITALREGTGPRPDLADAVEARHATDAAGQRTTETLPVWVSKGTWDRAEVKATSEGRNRVAVVDEGFAELLAGNWVPKRPARAGYGKAEGDDTKRASRTLRFRSERLAEVSTYLDANAARIGWAPSVRQVAAVYLEEYAPPEDTAGE
jgi:hypothetical protein